MSSDLLNFDLRIGGLGDNWMRLVGFYVAAALRPNYRIQLILPQALVGVSRHAFAERLDIVERDSAHAVVYEVRGIRDLIVPALRGRRYASPYGRGVIQDWQQWTVKDRLNSVMFFMCDAAGLILSPPWFSLNHYQGYSEIVAIRSFRDINIGEFERQLAIDYPVIRERLLSAPRSDGFGFSESLNLDQQILFFPSGTAYQFVPLEWAREFQPDAVYAFYHRDPDLVRWRAAGMKTVSYNEPGDMLSLALTAKVTVSTDSFPSHFLQYSAPRFVVMLTEAPRHRVISPAFRGPVVPSVAPCHPCPHLARGEGKTCKAGHTVCLSWSSPEYNRRLQQAMFSATNED